MSSSILINEHSLSSGKQCRLYQIKLNLIPNYFLLSFPKDQGQPDALEVASMLELGNRFARKLAKEVLADSEAYTLLYSGYSARREKGWHIHIMLLGNRWKKAWLYMILASKNFAQAIGLRKDDSPRR